MRNSQKLKDKRRNHEGTDHDPFKHPFRSFQNDSAQGKDSSGAAAYRSSTGNPSDPTERKVEATYELPFSTGSANSGAGNRNLT